MQLRIRPSIALLAFLYLATVHVVLLACLSQSHFIHSLLDKVRGEKNEITPHYRQMTAFHTRIDQNLPGGSVLFIGDSHIQGLAVDAIHPKGVNFGIGGDTTEGMFQRLQHYQSLHNARAVVLEIGFNDLRYRDDHAIVSNIQKILAAIPSQTVIVLCAIHPVGDAIKEKYPNYAQRIAHLNTAFQALTQEDNRVHYLDAFTQKMTNHQPNPAWYIADDLHLSAVGNAIWIDALTTLLQQLKIDE